MVILELVQPRPDWMGALRVALTRPAGVPERRSDEDPWQPRPQGRPRRISDDLAWLRHAMDDPRQNGQRPTLFPSCGRRPASTGHPPVGRAAAASTI